MTNTFSERWSGYQVILHEIGRDSTLPSNCLWEAVQYYQEQWYWLKKKFLRCLSASGFGLLCKMVKQHEFQLRTAIHTHSVLWVEKSIETLIMENYIYTDVPDPVREP